MKSLCAGEAAGSAAGLQHVESKSLRRLLAFLFISKQTLDLLLTFTSSPSYVRSNVIVFTNRNAVLQCTRRRRPLLTPRWGNLLYDSVLTRLMIEECETRQLPHLNSKAAENDFNNLGLVRLLAILESN